MTMGQNGMGRMFTLAKVRDDITTYDDLGWDKHSADAVAVAATPEELTRDGIKAWRRTGCRPAFAPGYVAI